MAVEQAPVPQHVSTQQVPQASDELEDPLKRADYNTFVNNGYCVEDYALESYGNFDLDYRPTDDLVNVRLRLAFAFVDGVPGKGDVAADFAWDAEADKETQTTFRDDFMEKVETAWSKKFKMEVETPTDKGLEASPKWSELQPKVAIDLQASDADPHFTVEVAKLPAGGYTRSTVTRPVRDEDGQPAGPGTVNLDTEDLTPLHKVGGSPGTKQRTVLHEFGHMLGLEDEYYAAGRREEGDVTRQGTEVGGPAEDNDAVMASGEEITRPHYASIESALNAAVSGHDVPVTFKTL